MARYLITGITGFVGSHLTNLLQSEGHQISGLVRTPGRENEMKWIVSGETYKSLQFIYANLTDRETIERVFTENKFDGIFHFGAQSSAPESFKDPRGTFETNTIGTINIAEAVARYQPECRLVFASSGEVYGKQTGEIDESVYLNPVTPYGVSKAAAELFVRERARSTKMEFVVGRGFTSSGPGRARNFAFSGDAAQIAEIKAGKREPVINVGNLDSQRAVMDIRDCARAYLLLMEMGVPGEAYNIAGEGVRKYGEYLDIMLEISGLKGKVELKKDDTLYRPNDISVQKPDSKKIRNELGWKQEIPIEKTLGDLLEYWDKKIKDEDREIKREVQEGKSSQTKARPESK